MTRFRERTFARSMRNESDLDGGESGGEESDVVGGAAGLADPLLRRKTYLDPTSQQPVKVPFALALASEGPFYEAATRGSLASH